MTVVTTLPSFIAGSWQSPSGEGASLNDAATGEEVARIARDGIDASLALDHGRRVGGPALGELTFHQRAMILKSLALYLNQRKDDLYPLSLRTGATMPDSRFDVDGGIGVLFGYSSKARRELPNARVLVDGDVEPLSRKGSFVGQHICTPLNGVAVQINAFNFPVWGPLEKFAPAFIAGVPSIIKPASQTAYLTSRLVELMVESDLLPEGSLQYICGGARDVFDHLTEQDLVSFTGSASTAQRLRTHRNVVERSVRFNAEADSLNCSILGPDATPGSQEFDLFIDQLITEMRVKAGQKCTAIRRAIVPADFVDDVCEAASARLRAVKVGLPSHDEVDMGPLASLEQLQEVRRSLKALMGVSRTIFGDPDSVVVSGTDASRGAFISPILLAATDPGAPEPHEVEAFGPVSTLIPYRTADEAVGLAARGRGSLVGSVVTSDPDFAAEVVLGIGPWHGRILVLDRDNAAESTGHGSPLPTLVHGGPGRAGGGEEMGGMRGVMHHMQRTAVQGSPRTLSRVTGTWVPGSQRHETDRHVFRKYLEELQPGDTVIAGPRKVSQEDVEHFADFTGDRFYAHMNDVAAAANPFFESRVAHGYLIVSFAAGLFVSPEPGPVLANYGLENLRFLEPVYFGDELTVTLTAKEITPREDADYGEVRWDADVTKQDGSSVARYDVLTLVAKKETRE